MASNGIKDRVAIVGMGCTKFGEHWDKGSDDLLVDAAYEAYASAGVGQRSGGRLDEQVVDAFVPVLAKGRTTHTDDRDAITNAPRSHH